MKKELWLRLKHYHFEHIVPPQLLDRVTAAFGRTDASTMAFANKISRKLDWTTGFAIRAIEEYKKFLFLGIVSDFPVTPSRVIDQVWHEHLLFSRAYREFCRDVLGRDFDHNPELLPSAEQTGLFQTQYELTIELYATEFRVKPPADIWSLPKFNTSDAAKSRKSVAQRDAVGASSGGGDVPLFMYFDGSDGGDSSSNMSEFGGGGGFSGGGGDSSWGGGSSDASPDSGSSSDSGGSSCSSGCGGGGE